jgi:hypothetical protein
MVLERSRAWLLAPVFPLLFLAGLIVDREEVDQRLEGARKAAESSAR